MRKGNIIKLEDIKNPEKLKELNFEQLNLLTYDIRDFLIDKISKTGGHLSPNLGVVELSIAIHKVFETPKDKVIWDVGHQSYVHKMLTGRLDKFDTLRKWNGISGFPKRNESEHDFFDTGHSSNSISVATGMAISRDRNNENHDIVAVIGDGALTGGLAFEGLNNLGHLKTKVIVILNDNEMSISKNTGSITQHLYKLRMSEKYINFKKNLKKTIVSIPLVGKNIFATITNIKNYLKYAIVDGIIFEELGFKYIGPLDGHNIEEMVSSFEMAKNSENPVLIHILTKKGKGYKNSELMPNKYHGISPFNPLTGDSLAKTKVTYSNVFGKEICKLAENNEKIVVISAAMIEGTGLKEFLDKYPSRIFDVGIAEGHAVSFAAGLAVSNQKPIVAIYSTFLQRAYDQIVIDVCLQNLPVVFAIDRAGIVGSDGETHHGIFDLSYLSHIPNMTILSPSNKNELELLLKYAIDLNAPCAIRYPRGEVSKLNNNNNDDISDVIKNKLIHKGNHVTIVTTGKMVDTSIKVVEILKKNKIEVQLINVKKIKPISLDYILESVKITKKLVTIEDNLIKGGFGELIEYELRKLNIIHSSLNLGWEDKFIPQGKVEELYEEFYLSEEKIAERVSEFFER